MKFTMRHPISHQRMVIPLGIEALSLYLPQSRIKNIHIFSGPPSSLQVLFKGGCYFDEHSSAISLSTSLRSSEKDE